MIRDFLRERFSVRQFQSRTVPEDILNEIPVAGRLAPSGGNEQPWRFGVIRDRRRGRDRLLPDVDCICAIADRSLYHARGGCTGRQDIQKQRYPEYADEIAGMDQGLYWAINQEEHQSKIVGTQWRWWRSSTAWGAAGCRAFGSKS